MSIFIAEYTDCSDYQNHVYVQYGNYHGFVLEEESFKDGDKVVVSNYNSQRISVNFGDTVLILNRHNLKTDSGQELPRKYFSTVLKFLESRRW